MDELDTEQQREIIQATCDQARRMRWAKARDLKGWERMLERANSAKGLRAGRIHKDATTSGAAECKKQIAQLEFDIERLDITIEDCVADLAALPEPSEE